MKSSAKKRKQPAQKPTPMPLERMNYLFLGIGALVIALSYVVMYAENSADGFFSLYVCPYTLVGAYAWVLFSLLYRKTSN